MFWDPTYILVIIGAVICMAASWNVNRTFSKFSRFANVRGMTGRECAAAIMRGAGIDDVRIERIRGNLTDHYSPKEKVLRLSDNVYGSNSIAALGVAAHECGHAIQHKVGYLPLRLRAISVPVANFGSFLSWPVILIGLALGQTGLAQVGVVLFGFVVVFQLITLPVEFDASRRALAILEDGGLLMNEEMDGARKVLKAAALTYVAALFNTLLQLLRLAAIVNRNSHRN